MSNNFLASYFTNADASGTTDLVGKSFFDLISECKDFNDRDATEYRNDDFYDIWPLPERLTAQPPEASLFSNRQFYFAINEPLLDPVKLLVMKHFGAIEANKRQFPSSESVIADANGIQILIKCGCFRSVINLTHKILKSIERSRSELENNGQASSSKTIYTPYSMQIWFIRIAMLMKLKLFKEAEAELRQFDNFDKPEYFYQFHKQHYPNRTGSMVAFGLRMLNAEVPFYLNRGDESISNLLKLIKLVNKVIGELKTDEAKKLWNERKLKVQYSLCNILLNKKSYEKAIEILDEIVESDYSNKCSVWSLIGKVYLQIGDQVSASNSFLKAKNASNLEDEMDQCRNLLNLSHLRIFSSMYKEAYEFLKEANSILPENSMIVNNMAFCLFYSGHLKEAISLIEKHINQNPAKNLNETLVFNLCTLYELESSKAQQKKLTLLLWLNVYVGDGFYEHCIQLQ